VAEGALSEMTREPPYWPYRCEGCSRYVSNPRCTYNEDRILSTAGDCKCCGPGVPLLPLAWEDWFGWDDEVAAEQNVRTVGPL
jgi:hypothetical protein